MCVRVHVFALTEWGKITEGFGFNLLAWFCALFTARPGARRGFNVVPAVTGTAL